MAKAPTKAQMEALNVNEETGLVPVKILVSEAGLGLRANEIRGVSPETALRMVELGSAELVDVPREKKAVAKPVA